MSVLREIDEEISCAIEESLVTLARISQPNYCLLIARAGVEPLLERIGKTKYVMDNAKDVYHDETRQQFYLDYLNANYRKGVLNYTEEDGLDKLIAPLKTKGLRLGDIIYSSYSSHIRNSFAHSLFDIDLHSRKIQLRSKHIKNYEDSWLTFNAFQDKFLHSIFLCYCLTNIIDRHRMDAAGANTAITDAFLAPNGRKMQLFGELFESKGKLYPRFRGAFIKDEA